MGYVITGVVLSVIVSIVYLGSIWASFGQVKKEKNEQPEESPEQPYAALENEKAFSWKAVASIVLSSALLFALGKSAFIWYLVPFITIGTSIAIIFAFAIDFRKRA